MPIASICGLPQGSAPGGSVYRDAAFNADELLVEFRRTLGARADSYNAEPVREIEQTLGQLR